MRLTFDHAPIGVAVITPDGAVTRVNPALCELLGLPEQLLLDGGFRAALHPEERGSTRRRFAAILTCDPSEPLLRELRFVHASGRSTPRCPRPSWLVSVRVILMDVLRGP